MRYKLWMILGILLMGFGTVCAQDGAPTKKNYLPEQGNIGIGADATPIFDYFGNMLGSSGNNTLDLSNTSLFLKYYLTDETAIRAIVGINASSPKTLYYAQDDAAYLENPLGNIQTTDSKEVIDRDLLFSLAWQKFIGQRRLRGFYGLQAICGYTFGKDVYTYGNPMTILNPSPSVGNGGYYAVDERLLENQYLNTLRIGAGVIAGFEYYLMPQLCIGGEISMNLLFSKAAQSYIKTEKMIDGKYVELNTALSPGGSDLSISTASYSSNQTNHLGLYVMLHF